jgi:hypothetical protein
MVYCEQADARYSRGLHGNFRRPFSGEVPQGYPCMVDRKSDAEVFAVKDESHGLPIPSAWRPVFREIVGAFVQRDYRLSAGVLGVAPVTNDTAAHIEKYIGDYGETLVELPEETWDSSVCI